MRVYPYSWSRDEAGIKRRTVAKAPVALSEVEREGGEAERKKKRTRLSRKRRARRRRRNGKAVVEDRCT